MGYSPDSKAYRLLDKSSGRIITSRDVKFIEETRDEGEVTEKINFLPKTKTTQTKNSEEIVYVHTDESIDLKEAEALGEVPEDSIDLEEAEASGEVPEESHEKSKEKSVQAPATENDTENSSLSSVYIDIEDDDQPKTLEQA